MSLQDGVRRELESMAEVKYREFSAALVPGVERMLGIRLPQLRAFAKRLAAQQGWLEWLEQSLQYPDPEEYFEEIMLQGMVIGCAKLEAFSPEAAWCKRMELTRAFVPKINNWSVCDSFCAGLKRLSADRAALRDFLSPFPRSEHEFETRFGVIMIMDYFLDKEHLAWALENLDAARHPGYYAKMGVAWALSVSYVRFPAETFAYLHSGAPDPETLDMALRKILDSRRVKGGDRNRIYEFRSSLRG